MTRGRRATPCPWCGRDTTVTSKGVLPRHKRVTGTTPDGDVTHGWCEGGGDIPYTLTHSERRYLRTLWRDEGGELIEDADT
ncbi:MAG TPA: hypothetical protein VFW65_31900 [Pseudonocardiaceae bacterium]|nr:hypothetical protein [Pseudonocardiaceae bacterium]